jgi:hypothetical protein
LFIYLDVGQKMTTISNFEIFFRCSKWGCKIINFSSLIKFKSNFFLVCAFLETEEDSSLEMFYFQQDDKEHEGE